MILVDTSAWIDYLRAADTPVVETLSGLIDNDADVATTEPVIMELLAGAGKPAQAAAVAQLTNGLPLLGVDPRLDFRAAAELHVTARRGGRTIRSIIDCLIAAVAIRNDVPLLHKYSSRTSWAGCLRRWWLVLARCWCRRRHRDHRRI